MLESELNEFNKLWVNSFGDLLPISHIFKWVFKSRWLRIYSLDNAKRYADTEEEYKQILIRQNILFESLINSNELIYMIYMKYENDISNSYYDKIISLKDSTFLKNFEIEKQDESIKGEIFIKTGIWHPNSLDDVLLGIADDEIRVIIMPTLSNRLIIPYDGGIDIILENSLDRDAYLNKFSSWTSKRLDGL